MASSTVFTTNKYLVMAPAANAIRREYLRRPIENAVAQRVAAEWRTADYSRYESESMSPLLGDEKATKAKQIRAEHSVHIKARAFHDRGTMQERTGVQCCIARGDWTPVTGEPPGSSDIAYAGETSCSNNLVEF